ncbi:amidase domain-containing protein [Salinibacterium sp. NK8237]|uniref:amidase domain-containing protein n=1 Tax=Salinibacterium sp. NK8237 TaxID=2792038 RepID=UPI0018CF3663|nr:amidase domain-containing protein [Salinibacterium sp. NK8237]MBH0130270.1 amidase domain-containing protein [Salinibacterium sp. NK8237]
MASSFLVRRIGVSAAALGVVAAITAFVVIAAPVTETAAPAEEEAVAAVVVAEPEVQAISSATGTLVAGESLVITGTALDDVTDVTFGGVSATDVVVTDSETVTVTVPSAVDFQPSTVDIAVLADDAAVPTAETLDYTYEASTPVDNQMQYLMEHWEDYNVDEYGDLNSVGGDCANFASQSLLMRGWDMTADWFNYDAAADWSGAWGYVPTMEIWLNSNPELGATQLSFDERDQAKVGDLVVFDWNDNDFLDHIQVVSSVETVDGETVIKMVGHNLDTNYRDLDETITVDHPGATGHFWSIP